jgi:hypothetical protein
MNFYPRAGQLQGAALNYPNVIKSETDWSRDFNGIDKQSATFRGAYAGSGTNPGWKLDATLKQLVGANPVPMAPTNLQIR